MSGKERGIMTAYDLSRARWRKSSRSGGNGGGSACVEIAVLDESVAWRKSSRSGGNGSNGCVEVAFAGTGVGLRDSKDRGGPALAFAADRWRSFIRGVQTGSFDLPG